jgi:hypothetical protein
MTGLRACFPVMCLLRVNDRNKTSPDKQQVRERNFYALVPTTTLSVDQKKILLLHYNNNPPPHPHSIPKESQYNHFSQHFQEIQEQQQQQKSN